MSSLNATNFLATTVFFVVLDISAVACRFCSRLSRRHPVGVDDWICIPALAVVLGCAALLIYGISEKIVGYHTEPPTSMQQMIALEESGILMAKVFVSFSMISSVAITLIKLAFLLCFRRIFSGVFFSYANWALLSIAIAWGVTFFVLPISACGSHLDQLWAMTGPMDKCIDTTNLALISSITDFAIDLAIMVLPLPCVWGLNMKLGKKLAVSAVFLTGAIATASAAMRMAILLTFTQFDPTRQQTIFGMAPTDITGVISFYYLFTWIELGIGMFVCCLPSLRLLLDQLALGSVISSVFSSFRSSPAMSKGSVSSSSSATTRSAKWTSWSSKSSFARSLGMSPKPASIASFDSRPSRRPSTRPYESGLKNTSTLRDVEVGTAPHF